MTFGINNAPTTFYNLMNDILFEYLDEFMAVFLDVIVIYHDTAT